MQNFNTLEPTKSKRNLRHKKHFPDFVTDIEKENEEQQKPNKERKRKKVVTQLIEGKDQPRKLLNEINGGISRKKVVQSALEESEDSDDNGGLTCDKNKLIEKLDLMKIENKRLKKELTNFRTADEIHQKLVEIDSLAWNVKNRLMQLDTITAQAVFNAQQSERKEDAQQPLYDYETDTDVESNFPNNLIDSPVGVNTISLVNEPTKQPEFMNSHSNSLDESGAGRHSNEFSDVMSEEMDVEESNYQNHEKRLQDEQKTSRKIISNSKKEFEEPNLGGDKKFIKIGPKLCSYTAVSNCNRRSITKYTAELAGIVFTKEELATSSLTGSQSNANKKITASNEPNKLNPESVEIMMQLMISIFGDKPDHRTLFRASLRNKCSNARGRARKPINDNI